MPFSILCDMCSMFRSARDRGWIHIPIYEYMVYVPYTCVCVWASVRFFRTVSLVDGVAAMAMAAMSYPVASLEGVYQEMKR